MALQTTCPKGHKLSLDEKFAGKKVKCPRCQTPFVVAAEAAPAPKSGKPQDAKKPSKAELDRELAAGEERRQERLEIRREQLLKVSNGLVLALVQLGVYIGAILFGVFGSFMARLRIEEVPEIFNLIAVGIGLLIGPALGVAIGVMGAFAPKKAGCRAMSVSNATFHFLSFSTGVLFFLAFFGLFEMDADRLVRFAFFLVVVACIGIVIAYLFFLVYARTLAAYLKDSGLGNEFLNLIVRFILNIGSFFPAYKMADMAGGFGDGVGQGFGGVFYLLVMLVYVGLFYYLFFYSMIKLLKAVRKLIDESI